MHIGVSNIKQIIVCVLCITWFSFRSNAQNEKKAKEKYTVYIEGKETLVKASVLSSKIKISTKKELKYHWYAANKIMETQGGYDGKLLQGDYAEFYQSNNNLRAKGKFKYGLKQGEWIIWNENGKISEASHWKNGLKCGSYKTYNSQGEIVLNARYKKDLLDGKTTTYGGEKILGEKMYKKGLEVPYDANKKKSWKDFLKIPGKKEKKKVILTN